MVRREENNNKKFTCFNELNFFSGWLEAGFSWNWGIPPSQEKLYNWFYLKNVIGTVYVYHCGIFLIILTQKILNLVSDQDAFYMAGSTLGV